MQVAEIKAIAEEKLGEALGSDRVGDVAVRVAAAEDDGSEYLDIAVRAPPGRGLPTASESLAASRELRRHLALQGETRFPSIFFRSAISPA